MGQSNSFGARNMYTIIKTILILTFLQGCFGFSSKFTPMEINNHPCTPENLKRTRSYICDHGGMGCKHGICRAPNMCACEVGWEGNNCEICVRLPGCANGNCTNEFECNCHDGWSGACCDIPHCNSCLHGQCARPNDCICFDGWLGEDCSTCQKMPGCKHGNCVNTPNSCECEEGWEGVLCDQPVCDPPCAHGTCTEGQNGTGNFCICETGWKNENCSQCVPYWNCPNQGNDACEKPNECICQDGMDNQLCNHNSQNKITKANTVSSNEQMKGSRPSVGNSRGKDKNARPPVERPSGGRPPARGSANGTK